MNAKPSKSQLGRFQSSLFSLEPNRRRLQRLLKQMLAEKRLENSGKITHPAFRRIIE